MGLIEDYIRLNMFPDEEGNFNDRFIAYLSRNFIGTGSPEGVVAAPVGAAFWRVDGGANTILYVKESGTGDTGWVAYGAGGGGGGGFTQEEIEDFVGAMVAGNTETGITVTYVDGSGKIDFVAEVTDAILTQEFLDHGSAADPHTGYILESLIDAAGDLIIGSADNTPARLAKGATRGQILQVGASTLEWGLQALGSRFKVGNYYTASHSSFSNLATVADRLYAVPFYVGKSQAFDRITIFCATAVAATTFRMGIYNDTGEFYPGSLLLDAGTVDTSGSGSLSITIAQTLTPGWYWLVGVANGGTPTVRGMTQVMPYIGDSADPNNSVLAAFTENGVTGALPANFTASVSTVGIGPRIHLRAA